MNKVLEQIEQTLGFKLPIEIVDLYKKATGFPETTYFFNTRSIGSHWLLNGNYFLLKPQEENTIERGEYFIRDFYVEVGNNILTTVNKKVSESVKRYWAEDKVFAFAWSNNVVEQDASLIYVFDSKGSVKGVYIHSLNHVEEKIFVAGKLSDIFDLNQIGFRSGSKVEILSKINTDTVSYKELLKGSSHQIIDTESADDVKDYEDILIMFSKLSDGKFSPIIKSLNEQDAVRSIEIEINGRTHLTKVQGDSDYIDLRIIDFVNECLIDSGHTRKKFIAFIETSFGQEVGIAFVSKSLLKSLSELKSIRIIKGQ
jgi:hypothetical protein